MQNQTALQSRLPKNARLIIGDIAETAPAFRPAAPIGFVSLDVDYYSSSMAALRVFAGPPEMYLPSVILYMDDVEYDCHNEYCGELLAAKEFGESHQFRRITPYNLLRAKRIFQRAAWIDHMFLAHVFDHPLREQAISKGGNTVLDNPYATA